jgi:hypothetical protein
VLDVIPSVLQPGQYGQIEVKYCTEKTDDWDVIIDQIGLVINNKPVGEDKLSIVANVREDFRRLTPEQRKTAPVAMYDKDVIRFDTIAHNQAINCRFLLKNNGPSELKIRTVKASCGCTVAFPEKSSLAPGESTYIDAEFNPSGTTGEFKKGITVVTNDPEHYKKYLFVEGFILSTPQ